MFKTNRSKCFVILFLLVLSAVRLSSETVILKTKEEINGSICKFDDNNLYLSKEKQLYIIPVPLIDFVLDDRGIQLNLSEISEREFPKLNYNSFAEIKEIQDLKTRKKFKPRYTSRGYGTYYDRRVNKMIYGNTARTLEKNLFSFSIYDLFMINYSIGVTDELEIDIFTAPLISLAESGIAFKYNLVRKNDFEFSVRSGFKYLSEPFYDEGFRDRRYSFPTMLLFTYGTIDNFFSCYLGFDIIKDFDYDSTHTHMIIP